MIEPMTTQEEREFMARAEAARLEGEKLLIEAFGGDGMDDTP